jgi:hypothetical protein
MSSDRLTKSTLVLAYKRCPNIVKYILLCTTLIACSFAFTFALSKQIVKPVDFIAPTFRINADVSHVH